MPFFVHRRKSWDRFRIIIIVCEKLNLELEYKKHGVERKWQISNNLHLNFVSVWSIKVWGEVTKVEILKSILYQQDLQ